MEILEQHMLLFRCFCFLLTLVSLFHVPGIKYNVTGNKRFHSMLEVAFSISLVGSGGTSHGPERRI